MKTALVAAFALAAPALASAAQRRCETFMIPVTFAQVPDAKIWGELCLPETGQPTTVELLVHGSTHNHNYWDFPFQPRRYSHVQHALDGGRATFNIDRIGTGNSTKPLSTLVTVDATVDSIHQLVQGLRSGAYGGHAFSKVVYFGSSLSTAYGWQVAASYPADLDALVVTGLLHETTLSWLDLVHAHITPANVDPALPDDAGLDDGYVTTEPGFRATFFIQTDNTKQHVPAVDESVKGEVSVSLMFESAFRYVANPDNPALPPDPEKSVARSIHAPVLITLGEFDGPSCGELVNPCTAANILAWESPYYSQDPGRVLDVYVAPNTKHATPIHDSFVATAAFINGWLTSHGL